MVGAARCSAVATGLRVGRGAERGGEVLLPPAPREAAVTVAGVVIDCPPAMRTPVREHGWRARRRRFTRAALGGAIVCAGCLGGWLAGGPLWPLVLGAAVLAAGIPLAQDRYRNLGHATVGGYLVSGSGSLVRRRAALRQDAVIGWNVRSSWFQRRAGLVTLTATTAAGRQGYAVRDIPTGTALALAAAVTPGLLDPFRTAPPATSR
jgi:putative membrane protein